MKAILGLLLSCVMACGQNLFPPPGSPLMLDSTKLVPAITNSGGGAQVWTNNLSGDIFINGDQSPFLYDINTNGASGHHMLSSVALAELEGDIGTTNGYQLYINNVAPTLQYVYGPQFVTLIDPSQDDGDAPYVFDTPTNLAVIGSVLSDFRSNGVSRASVSFSGVERANGFMVHSNTLSIIPTLAKGDVFFWSSNGVLFSINCNQAGTLTTNKLAP